jgi:hypothetical protein
MTAEQQIPVLVAFQYDALPGASVVLNRLARLTDSHLSSDFDSPPKSRAVIPVLVVFQYDASEAQASYWTVLQGLQTRTFSQAAIHREKPDRHTGFGRSPV